MTLLGRCKDAVRTPCDRISAELALGGALKHFKDALALVGTVCDRRDTATPAAPAGFLRLGSASGGGGAATAGCAATRWAALAELAK